MQQQEIHIIFEQRPYSEASRFFSCECLHSGFRTFIRCIDTLKIKFKFPTKEISRNVSFPFLTRTSPLRAHEHTILCCVMYAPSNLIICII